MYRVSSKVVVSGSFNRHMEQVQKDVTALKGLGASVLSPAEPNVVGSAEGFVFLESDTRKSVRGIQDRHLEAIRASDFLWVSAPDGYVGISASMEIGFAAACGVPVYCGAALRDATLCHYVTVVRDCTEAVLRCSRRTPTELSILLDPAGAAGRVHDLVESLEARLTGREGPADDGTAISIAESIREILARPGHRRL